MAKKDTSAKGFSKVVTPEEHNEARRAAKAKQKANHAKSGGQRRATTNRNNRGFTWAPDAYKATPLFQVNQPMPPATAQGLTADFAFAQAHADLALLHPAILQLAVGSPARILAEEALMQYPYVERTADTKRTDAALNQAIATLTPEGRTRFSEGVIKKAGRCVKAALLQTFDEARQHQQRMSA